MESRITCTSRIPLETGMAVLMGIVGGGLYHSAVGLNKAPISAYFSKVQYAKAYANIMRGESIINFGKWGFYFSSIECACKHFRKQDDFLNPIIAAFFTGVILNFRRSMAPVYILAHGGISAGLIGLMEMLTSNEAHIMLRFDDEGTSNHNRLLFEQMYGPLPKIRPRQAQIFQTPDPMKKMLEQQ